MSALAENPNCDHANVSFRLVGERLDPERVTATLGLEPTFARAKGVLISGGEYAEPRHQRTGVWSVGSREAVNSTSIERHLVYLLNAIEPVAEQLWGLRREQDLRADFFCTGLL